MEQVIIRINDRITESYSAGILIKNEIKTLGSIEKAIAKKFDFFLNGVSNIEVEIANKIIDNSVTLNDIATNRRGGILQKFINDNIDVLNTDDLIVIGGAEIDKYGIRGLKGTIKKQFANIEQAFINKNSLLVQRLIAHIENPIDHISITACIPDKKDTIIVDTINQITIKEHISNKFVWCLLNSKLINWYAYRFILGKAIRTMQFDNPITSRIPIAHIIINELINTEILEIDSGNKTTNTAQAPFIALADTMLEKNKELQEVKNKFLELLKADFRLDKVSTKLQNWYEHSWADLTAELRKLKIELKGEAKEDWKERFDRLQAQAVAIKHVIESTDREIDRKVYELYQLTEEEIAIVDTDVQHLKPDVQHLEGVGHLDKTDGHLNQ